MTMESKLFIVNNDFWSIPPTWKSTNQENITTKKINKSETWSALVISRAVIICFQNHKSWKYHRRRELKSIEWFYTSGIQYSIPFHFVYDILKIYDFKSMDNIIDGENWRVLNGSTPAVYSIWYHFISSMIFLRSMIIKA